MMLPQLDAKRLAFLGLTLMLGTGCGGYKAADPDDLDPREGEIVGVLVDSDGKAHPDAWIELYLVTATAPTSKAQGMDSDGRFGVFPPDTGTYNLVGSFGDPEKATEKATVQNVSFTAGGEMNIGQVKGQKVAILSVKVTAPEGLSADGILVQVLGYGATATTSNGGVAVVPIGIPAGSYTVRFSKEGLETLSRPDVTFYGGEAKVIDDVTMTAAAP